MDSSTLLLSLVTGGAGFVRFVYGKRQQRWPHMIAGVAFMVYPYFVSSLAASVVMGAAAPSGLKVTVAQGETTRQDLRIQGR